MRGVALGVVLVLVGCGASSGPSGPDASSGPEASATCGPGLKAHGPACVPTLDECPEGQIPLPGGGCQRVGVQRCQVRGFHGIKGPPDWTCKPIGVRECPGGLMSPDDWKCRPIAAGTCPGGILLGTTCHPLGPTCGAGWTRTSEQGWCEPAIPPAPCAPGTLAVLGSTQCQAVASCGGGPWGKLSPGESLFVDHNAAPDKADGSQEKPYATIGAALQAAPPGATVRVAAGTYAEDLVIDQDVTLQGRCPAEVTIQGQSPGEEAAAIRVLAGQVVLRSLSVTGPAQGVRVEGGELRLDRVVVQGCKAQGVTAEAGSILEVQDSLVDGNVGRGIDAMDADVLIERSEVRFTSFWPQGTRSSAGILTNSKGGASSLVVRDSMVAANHVAGISIEGTTGLVERTLVHSSQVADHGPSTGAGGRGIGIWPDWDEAATLPGTHPSDVVVRDCVIFGNRHVGIGVFGSRVVIERTVVRDTTEDELTESADGGILAMPTDALPVELTLRDSAVVRADMGGVVAYGATVTLERALVQDHRFRPLDKSLGAGVLAYRFKSGNPSNPSTSSRLAVRDSVILHNTGQGMFVWSSEATVQRSLVADTAPGAGGENAPFNAGILAYSLDGTSRLVLQESVVRDNLREGVMLHETFSTIERSVIRDTRMDPASGMGDGITAFTATLALPAADNLLTVRDSLITGHDYFGMELASANAEIERTVIESNRTPVDHPYCGSGISAHVNPYVPVRVPSSVTLRDVLVADNLGTGVGVYGSKGVFQRTIVSGTGPCAQYPCSGMGVVGDNRIHGGEGDPAALELRDVLLDNNTLAGMHIRGSTATVQRAVMRDTRTTPLCTGFAAGIGIGAEGHNGHGKLAVREALVERCAGQGLALADVEASVARTVVRQTAADRDGLLGVGIAIQARQRASTLTLEDCSIVDSHVAGVRADATPTVVKRTVVRDTGEGTLEASEDRGRGDGIWAFRPDDAKFSGSLDVSDSLVQNSARSCLLFDNVSGAVRRSVLCKSLCPFAWRKSAGPILEDNVFENNTDNRFCPAGETLSSVASIPVPPAPPPPPP